VNNKEIIKDELKNIYFNSPVFKDLRNDNETPKGCKNVLL